MPTLYRSKSFRRIDENNTRLTDFLEKDNIKVLATAAAQLFISAPHLDKWFKSSTGTICFLKNFTQKSSYFFRLYSLMQGQLWEQEMSAPFVYQKASPFFHYLTVNRFNYGFKFICEDEAERFYSCIKKTNENHNDDKTIVTKSENNLSESTRPIRLLRRNLSADVCGSYLNVPQKNNKSEHNEEENAAKKHKSRRNDSSSRINKNAISCPFRCSSTELSAKKIESEYSIEKFDNEIAELPIQKQQYSSIVKRAMSSASQTSTSTKQINVSITQNQHKALTGSTSTINTMSFNGIETNSSPETMQSTPKLPIRNKEITESEIINKLLIKFNVSINKKMIKVLKDYINQFGGLEKFKKAIENRDEFMKLNAYIAATNATLIRESIIKQQNRYQTVYPINSSGTPPSPIIAQKSAYLTPTTPIYMSSKKYEPLTPYSAGSKTHSDRTPIRTNPSIINSIQQTSSRIQTPSPLRQNQILKLNSSGTANLDSNAPPKPPRRSSLKVN